MTERSARVSVRILEKEYQVACLPEERSELLDSAEYLNVKMREIRDAGNIVGLDRIAVMAALNLAHELLKLRGRCRRRRPEDPRVARARRECADPRPAARVVNFFSRSFVAGTSVAKSECDMAPPAVFDMCRVTSRP
jgi:cell division protein ZapA